MEEEKKQGKRRGSSLAFGRGGKREKRKLNRGREVGRWVEKDQGRGYSAPDLGLLARVQRLVAERLSIGGLLHARH